MKQVVEDSLQTRAERREVKKRPRMKVHGASLRVPNKHAGMKLAAAGKRKKR
jgi:hypothetical protein